MENGPAEEAGLISYFDFIVAAGEEFFFVCLGFCVFVPLCCRCFACNAAQLSENEHFQKILSENDGKALKLLVWNVRAQAMRGMLFIQ